MVSSQDGIQMLGSIDGSVATEKPLSPTYLAGILRIGDFILTVSTAFAIYYLYVANNLGAISLPYLATIIVGGLAVIAALQFTGAYSRETLFAAYPPIARIGTGLCIAFSILLAIAFLTKVTNEFSRVWAISWLIVLFLLATLFHSLTRYQLRKLASQGRFAARTVIVGAGEAGRKLAEHLATHGDPNIKLVGFFDDRVSRTPPEVAGLPMLGSIPELVDMIRRSEVDQVLVALPWVAAERLRSVVNDISITPVRVLLAPDLVGFHFLDRSFEKLSRLSVLHLHDRPISEWACFTKELEDRLLSGALILFLAPLLILISISIKLESPGPILFKQRRYGYNNQEIEVWKFRTMYVDKTDEDCEVQTERNDPRVTRFGRFLRRSSLDELAQLFNVFFGSMSLVGPRPHAMKTKAEGRLFEEVVDRYAARHRVKPGITGWAQVNGWRGETDTVEKIQNRIEHDLYYIDNWSMWFDIYILARTFHAVLSSRNAY